MKRNFSKSVSREKIDKVDRKATVSGGSLKEKSTKRRLSIYDDFDDDEMDEFDPKSNRNQKLKR
ncbi:MAG TPA: hypothetical protein PKJ24_08840 [Prolixibacteraceae bacterium]|nr:hypothetical protein [Prolixibacteraceae bacterium]HPT30375.1 hypothetical protein [Prolixibacteraceae bacterium]